MHLSYNNLSSIAVSENKIFGASKNGILVINRQDKSLSSYNKLNGLSSSGITYIAFDPRYDQLLAAYSDGVLDIIKNDEVINFRRLKTPPDVTGSKRINHITIHENSAYLATDFGVVVFDLQKLEITETWRDLSSTGTPLKIFETAFLNDSIMLATEKGVMVGNIANNLLDFRLWKRFDQTDFNAAIAAVTVFQDKFYVAVDGKGVFKFEDGNFVKQSFLQTADFRAIQGSQNNLLIIESSNLWRVTTSGQITQVQDNKIVAPMHAIYDASGIYWVADGKNGLVSNVDGNFVSYIPNGPATENIFRLRYANQAMFALPGGFSSTGNPLGIDGTLNIFSGGLWQSENTGLTDLTDLEYFNGKRYVSSFGLGLQQSNGMPIVFDPANSPLKSSNVTAVEISENGLWVTNYGADPSMHVLKSDMTWQSYTLNSTSAKFALDLAADFFGNIWAVINPSAGGGLVVLNPQNGSSVVRNDLNSGLPHKSVRSIAADRDGNIWVGTDAGVAYYISEKSEAIKPIIENRFLLRDEKVTAIAVDGGNRKWIGTERGVWLVSPSGEEAINNFTTENSPLLSDVIRDIEINQQSGEVFFATDNGMVSYQADATASTSSFQKLRIFPNPVTSAFSGTVGISGLATDAIVKITDVSGKLIWQTRANGGMATWNLRDYNGRRASTGIYLVFAATPDGAEAIVGKIAVVE